MTTGSGKDQDHGGQQDGLGLYGQPGPPAAAVPDFSVQVKHHRKTDAAQNNQDTQGKVDRQITAVSCHAVRK